jgi:lactate racemase
MIKRITASVLQNLEQALAMIIHLPYGRNSLEVQLLDTLDISVIEPVFVPGIPEPTAALRSALSTPLGSLPLAEQIHPHERVGIIFNDITRATPNSLILHAILDQLAPLPHEQITLFNALGTHRPNTLEELRRILDDDLVDHYRIVQNNAFDPSTQVHLGSTSQGHEIWINRELYECDLKILTGFIEPHFFAGFSGGGKALMPGMAGFKTILGNHSASNINHSKATWGTTHDNPIWKEVREVALRTGRLFLVNVALNKAKQISAVFCGSLDEAHARGCEFVRQTAIVPVPEPFDIVITTNSGYPLDINLYQSVKGMSAAAQVVHPGGAILIAAECSDGIPEHGLYGQLLRAHSHPSEVLEDILSSQTARLDQWEAQVQALVQQKADVYIHSSLTDQQVRAALLNPAPHIETTIAKLVKKYGPHARICVLPEGPQTIPQLILPA